MAKTLLQKIATTCECGHSKADHERSVSYCKVTMAGTYRELESCTCAAFHEAAPWNINR